MKMTCIVCPNGCDLTVEQNGEQVKVSGNRCPRGETFAVTELTNPMRTICSTVGTSFPQVPVLPVRTNKEIPKNQIFQVMEQINQVVVDRPVKRGEPVISNVLGLGVDIIATSNQLAHIM